MMKNQQIFVTIFVLAICQWSVITSPTDDVETTKASLANTTVDPTSNSTTTSTITPQNTTSTTTTSSEPTTTKATTSTTPTTTTSSEPTTTKATTSTLAPNPTKTTVAPPTTAKPTPAPEPCNGHFNVPSFIGGIVLTIGMIAIGFVAHKIYKSKFDRNYHTL